MSKPVSIHAGEIDWMDEPATTADRLDEVQAAFDEVQALIDRSPIEWISTVEGADAIRNRDLYRNELERLKKENKTQATAASWAAERGLTATTAPADILTREFPPHVYSWSGYYPQKACAGLVGEGAVGKSTFALAQALHNAAGLPFLGQDTIAGTVVYFSAEDSPDEVWRRVQRIVKRMPAEYQQLAIDNFRLIDAVGKRLYFVVSSKTSEAAISKAAVRIAAYITTEYPDCVLVIVDTVSRINGCNENSNDVMAAVVDAGERIAQKTGAAVVLLHHTSKAAAREGIDDLHTGRGGSAFGDNTRSLLRLMPAQEAHCKGLNISAIDRKRGDILRLVHAKNSYGRKQDVVWLRRLMDGTLQPFEPGKVDAAVLAERQRVQLLEWAATQAQPFNLRTVRETARAEIWGGDVSQAVATSIYKAACEDGYLIDSDVTVNGRPKQIVNPATADEILKAAAELEAQFDMEEQP